MSDHQPLTAVRERIAAIRSALATRAPTADDRAAGDGVVQFEVSGEPLFVTIERGLPVAADSGDAGVEWSLIVDDWSLVAPLGRSRALADLDGCRLRLDGELLPLPTRFEADRYTPERFPERIPRALLYVFNEQHGTAVGSVRFSVLFEDGVPSWAGDDPDPAPGVPRIALAYGWPVYWEYRRRRAPQLRVTNGASIDGHYKHLYTLHGLQDHEGFFRNVAEYPELPPLLLTYCRALAAASSR